MKRLNMLIHVLNMLSRESGVTILRAQVEQQPCTKFSMEDSMVSTVHCFSCEKVHERVPCYKMDMHCFVA
jgi:hypothetical protein